MEKINAYKRLHTTCTGTTTWRSRTLASSTHSKTFNIICIQNCHAKLNAKLKER
jgi:hypothetical protein